MSPTWVKTPDHNVDVDSVMVMVKNNLHGPLDPEWCTAIPFVRGNTVEGLKCKMVNDRIRSANDPSVLKITLLIRHYAKRALTHGK